MQSMGTLGLAEETDRGPTIQDNADYHLAESDQDENKPQDRWVTLVEDGSDLATCKKCKVNLRKFIEKYNFENQGKEIKDR
jgi:hypothetical protein